MKKKRVKWIVLLMFAVISLSGCDDVKNFLVTESSMTQEAKKALRAKYGEQFEIYDVYSDTQGTFVAMCSPTSDPSVVFEAQIWKDGEGVIKDHYIEGIVDSQIEQYLYEKFDQFCPECYIVSHAFSMRRESVNIDEVTMTSYAQMAMEPSSNVRIYIPVASWRDETTKEEYDYFATEIPQAMSNQIIPHLTFGIYGVNSETMDDIVDYWNKHTKAYWDYEELVAGYKELGFGYPDDEINISFSEYNTLKKEIITNK